MVYEMMCNYCGSTVTPDSEYIRTVGNFYHMKCEKALAETAHREYVQPHEESQV